jgi:drug/metabolite transporter (DMT)-like permease
LGIILALTGALCWGVADFAARFASRRVGAYRALLFMQLFGFLALTAYLESRGGVARGVAPGWHPWALAVAAGLVNVTGSLALYHSFEVGVMSIVAPISSAYPALTVALSLLSGERIHPIRAAGLAVTLIGVLLAATSFAQSPDAVPQVPEKGRSVMGRSFRALCVRIVSIGKRRHRSASSPAEKVRSLGGRSSSSDKDLASRSADKDGRLGGRSLSSDIELASSSTEKDSSLGGRSFSSDKKLVSQPGVLTPEVQNLTFFANSSPVREPSAHAHLSKGVGWAIVAGALFGFLFWFLSYHVLPVVGSTVTVWVIRLTSFSALLLCAAPARQSLRIPHGGVWWLLAAVGVMDTAAFMANNAGLLTGQVAVVSVLASLYGAVTVLLSWIFLRERLEPSQWFGIFLIFAGIVLVSL